MKLLECSPLARRVKERIEHGSRVIHLHTDTVRLSWLAIFEHFKYIILSAYLNAEWQRPKILLGAEHTECLNGERF